MNVRNWSPTLRVYCLQIRTELPWDERGLISLLRFASFIPSHFVLSHSPLSSQLCAVDPLNNYPHSLPLVSAVSYQHKSTKFSGRWSTNERNSSHDDDVCLWNLWRQCPWTQKSDVVRRWVVKLHQNCIPVLPLGWYEMVRWAFYSFECHGRAIGAMKTTSGGWFFVILEISNSVNRKR